MARKVFTDEADQEAPATAEQDVAQSPEWLTLAEVATYTGRKADSVRNAVKLRDEFKQDGATEVRTIQGTKLQIKYISKAAVDAWIANSQPGTPRQAGKNYLINLTEDQHNTLANYLLVALPDVTLKSTARKTVAKGTDAEPNSDLLPLEDKPEDDYPTSDDPSLFDMEAEPVEG